MKILLTQLQRLDISARPCLAWTGYSASGITNSGLLSTSTWLGCSFVCTKAAPARILTRRPCAQHVRAKHEAARFFGRICSHIFERLDHRSRHEDVHVPRWNRCTVCDKHVKARSMDMYLWTASHKRCSGNSEATLLFY
ncbi:hypothetical protein DOTSEDRAFT_74848 [Dothistroma septosporum NZE10]|uniref:Uncharacterized protein n=1 Tax=Dothistroma septosporum (strain NZE10 / CBS 128990) TaxID=675120 RepID=N1PEY7_DOTSN|nr:hypothetical protein DOTSEDRAFT_74848 [Dothistroma septosporum NZE10]